MSRHVFLVAAEESGDALGAEVIDALRARAPDVRISGVGLQRMRDRGAASPVDLGGLAIVGLFDGLKILRRLKRAVAATVDTIVAVDPDVVVLVDSWGFMIRVGEELRNRGHSALRIKLIGPQVWATRPGRAKALSRVCDHLLCIHSFEQPYYTRVGLPTTVIGNPGLERMPMGEGAAFRAKNGVSVDTLLVGLLPGSRPSEIQRVGPVLEAACHALCAADANRKIVCVLAGSTSQMVRERAASWSFPHILVPEGEPKEDAFAAMKVAIACSGTVTTELAVQGAPVVVGYKLGWLTWAIARLFLMRSKFITLLNVAADKEIAPEFVQTRLTASRVAAAAERLLTDPAALTAQTEAQSAALAVMAGPGRSASVIAAETILALPAKR